LTASVRARADKRHAIVTYPIVRGGSRLVLTVQPAPLEVSTMAVISWLVSGLIIGAIAKFLMPGKDPGGILVTILLGIAGAFVGSYLGQTLGWYAPGQPAGWIASIVGAIILLGIYRLLKRA
jgi:uncharacterized membrane protein YeaQ/YmgE (transglycosylase-associated protein family)